MIKDALLIIIYLSLLTSLNAKEIVNVGIYENAPKIFTDNKSKPAGFFIDLLNEIALEEDWSLNYIHCEWAECLNMLDTGTIDIMPDVAFTAQRSKRFLFSNEPVISSWSVIYKHTDVEIASIFDLKKKKIAVLKDSIQSLAIKDLLKKFNIETPIYIVVKDFSEAFRLLKNKQVDSVIVNRFYELNHPLGNNIIKTNIVIKPSTLRYAFSQSRSDMAEIVTNHIKEFKKNKQSILHKSKERWLTPKKSIKTPEWLLWSLIGSIISILFLIFLVITFKRMVVKTSKKLIEKEKIMLMQSKQASMGEMLSLISHQWRQPLSVIGMSSNNIKASIELEEEITNQDIEEFIQITSNSVKYLSDTIDDFRNFFKPNKNITKTNISNILNKLKMIYANSLETNNIEFILENKQDYEIEIYINELLQVLLNIINNAKDALKEKETFNSKIILTTSQDQDNYYIKICDNAGGIPDKLADKIGTQYFTTKADRGSGLGLYMSKIIVEQNLHGSFSWKNIKDGVCFNISIPKSI